MSETWATDRWWVRRTEEGLVPVVCPQCFCGQVAEFHVAGRCKRCGHKLKHCGAFGHMVLRLPGSTGFAWCCRCGKLLYQYGSKGLVLFYPVVENPEHYHTWEEDD